MAQTLVIQSYRAASTGWLSDCRSSVKHWAEENQYIHRIAEDAAFFGTIPPKLRSVLLDVSTATASDAARLYWMRQIFDDSSVDRIIWVDDDVFMLGDGPSFPPDSQVVLNRELWLFTNSRGVLARRSAVSNALMCIDRHSPFLAFYIWAIERIASGARVEKTTLGPDLLTHWAKQIPFHVIASIPTTSPKVLADVEAGHFELLDSIIIFI